MATATRPVAAPALAVLPTLWVVALVAYLLGDTATTLAVVASPAHVEWNPIVAAAVGRFGAAGILAVKLLAVGFCAGLSRRWDDRLFTYGPPTLLCVLGAATTAGNLAALG